MFVQPIISGLSTIIKANMTINNMIGSVYGRLTVLKEGDLLVHKNYTTVRKWICKCECGGTIEVRQDSLRSGNTRSCGCLVGDTRRSRYAASK